MIEQTTVDVLIGRAARACRLNSTGEGLSPEEVFTVLVEYKSLAAEMAQASEEGYRTAIQKELDEFSKD